MRTVLAVFAVCVLAVAVVYRMESGMVVQYPAHADVSGAAPGEVSTLTGTLVKLRGECVVIPSISDTVIIDSTQNAFVVNQRSGLRLNLPSGEFDISVHFEVPRLAASGPASVSFHNTYDCGSVRVSQSSPAYAFEVLPHE